ncbi:MAG: hypothetical protein LBJ73_04270 [Rickettsiales bacterium]|jgi:hypothetical protein|nr:hypothetical protein [Rickettsiales bacterium]
MKKSAIIAFIAWVFTFQGAFAVVTVSDITGDYETDGATISTPEEDYDNGIYTTYNNGAQYPGLSNTYKGGDVYFSVFSAHSDLDGYLVQSVCASLNGGTMSEFKCSITRDSSNNTLGSNDGYCWCRLKRISDNLSTDGWVFDDSINPAAFCVLNCANDCASNANKASNFRSVLLRQFQP